LTKLQRYAKEVMKRENYSALTQVGAIEAKEKE
jgi:hypothetical protein